MANTKIWAMNETQKAFVEVLGNYPDGVTLFELGLKGIAFKTGAINTLLTKGIVVNAGERKFDCDVVYDGKVVGHITKTGAIYKLAQSLGLDTIKRAKALFFVELSVYHYTTFQGLCQALFYENVFITLQLITNELIMW